MTTQPTTVLRLDPRALKVLAHPLRSRLLTALRMNGPATATALAQALETNTGATSYHLRKLASVGLVEETEGGRGRERWWRAATDMHSWTERDVAGDPDGQAATDWLRRHYHHLFMERYRAWLDVQGSWPLEWQDTAGSSDVALRLSPARLMAFNTEVNALFERFRATPSDHPEDEEVVLIVLYAFPFEGSPR
jgi:DNA-binding transcriptional ArsR family regulator